RMLAGNGHFALTMTIACARAALAGIQGTQGSSLLVLISRNGTDVAVQVAGPRIGDSGLVGCCGLGAAASAASPSVAAFLGGGMADAVERTREMSDICIGESERFRILFFTTRGSPSASTR